MGGTDPLGLKLVITGDAKFIKKTKKDIKRIKNALNKARKTKKCCKSDADESLKEFNGLIDDPNYTVTISPTSEGNTYRPSTNNSFLHHK